MFEEIEENDSQSVEQRERVDEFVQHVKGHVGVAVPNGALDKARSNIRAPCVAGPPEHLLDELVVILESGLEAGFRMILHLHVPVILDEPASDELVISRMKGILPEPLFVDKLFLKLWILQDFSSIDSSSAAET